MQIYTKFRFRKPQQSKLVIANCDITIDNNITIGGVRFIYNPSVDLYGLQLPTRKHPDGEYYDIVRLGRETKEYITAEVVKKYEHMKAQGYWITE